MGQDVQMRSRNGTVSALAGLGYFTVTVAAELGRPSSASGRRSLVPLHQTRHVRSTAPPPIAAKGAVLNLKTILAKVADFVLASALAVFVQIDRRTPVLTDMSL